MATCLISLGSNIGDRAATLERAMARLNASPQIQVIGQSRWHRTCPIGGPCGQGEFLNGAACLETSLEPRSLLAELHAAERAEGRTTRAERWEPRSLDLDILLFEQLRIAEPDLVVPHPRMSFRRFVLAPAMEVAPEMLHPGVGWTIAQLFQHLNAADNYVALAGPIAIGKQGLSAALQSRFGGRCIADPIDLEMLGGLYDDPGGRAYDAEIEFLTRRAQQLDLSAFREVDSLAVSDYWFDQSLSYASVWLTEEAYGKFELVWQDVRQRLVLPKLTIVMDAPTDVLYAKFIERQKIKPYQLSREQFERLKAAVVDRATSPGHGPILHVEQEGLDPSDRVVTWNEAVAAVESMQSTEM